MSSISSVASYMVAGIGMTVASCNMSEIRCAHNFSSDSNFYSSLVLEKYGDSSDRYFTVSMAIDNGTTMSINRNSNNDKAIQIGSIKRQIRYNQIMDSFSSHSKGFPLNKNNYLKEFANSLCKLEFLNNVTSYDPYEETLDSSLRLAKGLELSVSQFLDASIDSPILFTIHRDNVLLVSDEIMITELVDKLNSVISK